MKRIDRVLWKVRRRVNTLRFEAKNFTPRIVSRSRGRVHKTDLWNLDRYLAEVCLDGLKRLRVNDHSTGPFITLDRESREELEKSVQLWHNTIDQMIEGFDRYVAADDYTNMSPQDQQKWQLAKLLLVQYWEYLWI